MNQTTKTIMKKSASVPAFGIEANTPNNGDLLVCSIAGLRLRGAIESNKTRRDAKTGEERVPIDAAAGLALTPQVPGMQLHVNPADLTYAIIDPLAEDDKALTALNKGLQIKHGSDFEVKGVPSTTGTLDKDHMKTLCRECVRFLEANEARVVKGATPTIEDVDELHGNYLLNPGSVVPNSQPRYEKDFDEWKSGLN